MNLIIIIDLIFLGLFILVTSILLYKNRKNLKQDGWLLLYRTKWGINLIEKVGSKYKKTLKVLSYVSIIMGFVLMIAMLYLAGQTVYLYLATPIATVITAPPVAPLIPYFPTLFGLESFFPPFYFIYFILAILIVASVHEFSHGIFARRYGIKIKSTGFAFLKWFPAIFGAFVEQDDRQMTSKGKFEQMSVLSTGVFANTLIAILFFILLSLFFASSFQPAGIMFGGYVYGQVNVSQISMINGVEVSDYQGLLDMSEEGLNKISTSQGNYVLTRENLEKQKGREAIIMYYDAPAINAELNAVITEINNVSVTNLDELFNEITKYSPNQSIQITTIGSEGEETQEIVLGENPTNPGNPWLGIGFSQPQKTFASRIYQTFSYKEDHIYYAAKYDGFSVFIKDLLWWIFIINILVALFNMLPLGILDGGRFFYLTILGITKSEKFSKRAFTFMTYLLLLALLVILTKWVMVRIF